MDTNHSIMDRDIPEQENYWLSADVLAILRDKFDNTKASDDYQIKELRLVKSQNGLVGTTMLKFKKEIGCIFERMGDDLNKGI
jgi:hypothetical protein